MRRYYSFRVRGFTLVELLVALAIVGAIMIGSVAGFKAFSNAVQVVMEENSALEDMSIAAGLMRRDLQLSGWGLPTASRVASDDSGGIAVLESDFDVDIDGNGAITNTINTDRLFVADGVKIVTDSSPGRTGGYFPDEPMDYDISLSVADAEAEGGQKALLTSATAAATSVGVSTTNVNYDTESPDGWYSSYNCADIRDNMAVIVGGNTTGGSYAVEGHRISSISPSHATNTNYQKCNGVSGGVKAPAATLILISGETLANSYALDTGSFAVPAVAWYIKQADDNVYWLYRNQHKVLANVVDFQVAFGVDVDQDGLEWSASVGSRTVWKRPEHTLAYLASNDPAHPKAASSGEVANHLRNQEVIESVRTVWIRITALRRGAAEEDKEDNIVATSYVTMVNLRN